MPSSFFTKTGTSAIVMTGVLLVGAVLRAGQLPVARNRHARSCAGCHPF